jgi:sulfatase modifying factor 1
MKRIKFYDQLVLLILVFASALVIGMHKINAKKRHSESMVYITGGLLELQDDTVTVPSFLMDKNLVTVAEFDEFVKATDFVTEADKFGDAGVFDPELQAFVAVKGANYKYPFGKDKQQAFDDHPATQVSWNDALAYARWRGKRLPSKLEWEFAARTGTGNPGIYSWGDDLVENGKFKANTWQGSFPFYNTREDGYAFTSPVGTFGENKLGLTDMGGNVWQWCRDIVEPLAHEKIIDASPRRLLKGGSYLCDPMVCHGYEISGVSSSTPESSMAHIGFRCAKDVKQAKSTLFPFTVF